MQYNPKTRVFEISIRMFTDDLEAVLTREAGGQAVQLGSGPAGPGNQHDPLIEKYVRKHFALIDGQKQRRAYTYVGHEQEADAQWVYLELPYAGTSLEGGLMQQSVLTDLFDDQVNLVNIMFQGAKKTLVFRKNGRIQPIGD